MKNYKTKIERGRGKGIVSGLFIRTVEVHVEALGGLVGRTSSRRSH